MTVVTHVTQEAAAGDTVAGVVELLAAEFEDRFELPTVARVVRGCRADLDCSPVLALPELVLRLARQRLLDTAPPSGGPRGWSHAPIRRPSPTAAAGLPGRDARGTERWQA